VDGPTYGSWVSMRLVIVPAVIGVLLGGSAVLVPALGVPAGLLLLISGYFAYARWAFSRSGRDIQRRMLELVTSRLCDWDGRRQVLDIGCGSGALAIRIAKDHPEARVLGVDTWGAAWEFSKGRCAANAAEGVAGRTSFADADAASLPFADGSFDAVVSNFLFHEVRRVKDKRLLLEEALRVLKPGGVFVFQDLFLWRRVYGPIDDLKRAVESWGIRTADLVDTSRSPFIPRALKLPFMLGTAAILCGRKALEAGPSRVES
jgi:SAM-dependent methyltransferase